MIRPWMKWYPRDWRADPRLRMCSLAARGLWIELIGYMHEAEPYGHLTINGARPTYEDMAALVGRPVREVTKAIAELAERQVFSMAPDSTIYSRRMVRDKAKADADAANGKGGGNPKLRAADNAGVNPPDKAHMPEAREPERKDAAPAAPDPERELFARGKEVLGNEAGGLIAKLLKAKNKNVALARSVIETASQKQDAREYVSAVIRGPKNGEFKLMSGIEGVI